MQIYLTRCVVYLLRTTQRRPLLSLLQILSNVSQLTESLFLAPNGYSLYCSALQSLLVLAKHCSVPMETVSCLNIILSFSFPPFFTSDWLSMLVNASLLAMQVPSVQSKGFLTLTRLLLVESERVLPILEEPSHRRTLFKAISDSMACVSNVDLHSAALKLVGALGGWARDHLEPIPCSPVSLPKPDPSSRCVFELNGGRKLVLSQEQLLLECSRVLSNFAKHPECLSMKLASAKRKALEVLDSLFEEVMVGTSERAERSGSDLLSASSGEKKGSSEDLRTVYLYVCFLAACNPVLHSKAFSLLRRCAAQLEKVVLQNCDNNVPALQPQREDVASVLGPVPPNFVCAVNPNLEFMFVALIQLLQGNVDFSLNVACEWVQLLSQELQDTSLKEFLFFFDSFVTALISLGFEKGWKTQLRVCSIFNFLLSLFDHRWAYRVLSIFLRFYLQTLNVGVGLGCDAGHAGR